MATVADQSERDLEMTTARRTWSRAQRRTHGAGQLPPFANACYGRAT